MPEVRYQGVICDRRDRRRAPRRHRYLLPLREVLCRGHRRTQGFPARPLAAGLRLEDDGLNMLSPFDLDDLRRPASTQAAVLHDYAMTLGYNVGVRIASGVPDPRIHVGPLGPEPEVLFQVWRVDQPSEIAATFRTAGSVKEHLKFLATLPQYCLDLENNPRVKVVPDTDGTATWITDQETGQSFGIRTADLDATRLCVHAESPPTIGNWRKNRRASAHLASAPPMTTLARSSSTASGFSRASKVNTAGAS